eukprot:366281-Chlamydomonas_euryale.AAC.17
MRFAARAASLSPAAPQIPVRDEGVKLEALNCSRVRVEKAAAAGCHASMQGLSGSEGNPWFGVRMCGPPPWRGRRRPSASRPAFPLKASLCMLDPIVWGSARLGQAKGD